MEGLNSKIAFEINEEIIKAKTKHPGDFYSLHEGYAVLLEEVDEVWDDIKKDQSKETIKKELIQVAAMAVRMIQELC